MRRRTSLRRSLVAMVTAIVCLVALGNPAAGVPATYDVIITGGLIGLSKTGVNEVIDLIPTTPSCTAPSTLQAHFTSATVSSNVNVTAISSSHVRTFGFSGTFLAVLTRSTVGNSAGHITAQGTAPAHTVASMRVGIQIRIYNTAGQINPCDPIGNPICTLALVLHLGGNSTSISTSNTFSLTGSSVGTVVAFPTCTAGPTYLIGTTAVVTSPLTGHLTGVV